jgi:hypothetical protein
MLYHYTYIDDFSCFTVYIFVSNLTWCTRRAIAQAVSRWLPTAAARAQTRGWSCGICGGQSGRYSQSTSVSPANLHSTNFSTITITYHLGLVQ